MPIDIASQIKDKKNLLIDVSFYIISALMVSLVICYFIFSAKIYLQRTEIQKIQKEIILAGTPEQKQKEEYVFATQKKINDFAALLQERKKTSNIFSFIEKNSLPEVWFSKFSVSQKNNEIGLDGETENDLLLSKQISIFEKSPYVKKIVSLRSGSSESGKTSFSISLALDPSLFLPDNQPTNQ